MLASLMDVIITEWAQSINLLCGCANPDLDTLRLNPSSLEIPELRLSDSHFTGSTNVIKAFADDNDYA